ncbi:hypothetical protein [Planomonospora sp. ID82291]|uniref:hypothetical protein n=1 Tax=Planomonospora sp. ID82291 TaxID=2738136 RepID=UPI0018C3C210|nr:hypothetical protein [Planomonospora sp. ID82291]MBG0812783.1 hypothetical protein [Planomonospora sp. ID82291]
MIRSGSQQPDRLGAAEAGGGDDLFRQVRREDDEIPVELIEISSTIHGPTRRAVPATRMNSPSLLDQHSP